MHVVMFSYLCFSGKKIQEKFRGIVSSNSHCRLFCCYGVIMALTVVVIDLSVALWTTKTEQILINKTYAACPKNWIGVGNKCFYFSENSKNWTVAQNCCMAQEAQLARFHNQDELNFLKRHMNSNHWIGLHRDSSEHPWRWTDNTEYNNTFLIQGDGECGFLSDNGISSSRDYIPRKWICSRSSNYTLQC
uniref:C-type lectin domain-containing protein n=1 Tax=Mus spicilegus TaxID=10103 RepID=A0A8C6GKR3_MUSSI